MLLLKVGVYEISFKSLALQFAKDLPEVHCALYCNFVTSYELDSNGDLKRAYSPIQVLQIKGTTGKLQLVSLNHQPTYQFSDISTIKLWLQDFESNKLDVEMTVHCTYRKKISNHGSH